MEHAVLIHADPADQHAAVGTLSPYVCCPAGPAGPYVAGGPVGPDVSLKVLEPLQHSVLDHADPAGHHAAVGTLSPSDCYPAGPAGPCVAGGHVGPDDWLQVIEPFEHSVLNHADPAGQHADLQETVESLEHSVVEAILDGRPMEGITCPELLERSLKLLDTTLDGGLVEKISDWEPVAHPVPDTTLDGRPMEGTTTVEHSVLVGSLDSGLMVVMSSLEPLEQSVPNTLLVARPVEGITETYTPERSALASQLDYGQSKLELSARPMLDIIQDGNTEIDTDPSERSAMATHVDYGLLHLESLSCPMVNVALDRRPMEGITAPLPVESSGLALAPDSGHVEYSPSSRPLEHSVLDRKLRNDKMDSSDESLFGSGHRQSSLELADAMRSDVLRIRSMGRVSAKICMVLCKECAMSIIL